jgi:hypothetical protein
MSESSKEDLRKQKQSVIELTEGIHRNLARKAELLAELERLGANDTGQRSEDALTGLVESTGNLEPPSSVLRKPGKVEKATESNTSRVRIENLIVDKKRGVAVVDGNEGTVIPLADLEAAVKALEEGEG